ncbi:hypothetical protein ENBRE01_2640 [Enteropsectra breve]|nr:hypothetical protein ENBRE01_2640 [Enteropsectra breve]
MMRCTSFLLFMMSEIKAGNEMMNVNALDLIENKAKEKSSCSLNEIPSYQDVLLTQSNWLYYVSQSKTQCLYCKNKLIRRIEYNHHFQTEKNVYNNYAFDYFTCPSCKSITHTDCLLNYSIDNMLVCPNPDCALELKGNDINKLFAQLLYVNLSRDGNLYFFYRNYHSFIQQRGFVNHKMLMDILIGSQTLHEIGQENLLELLLKNVFKEPNIYSEMHHKVYTTILKSKCGSFKDNSQSIPKEESCNLVMIGKILHSIEGLWKQFEAIASPHDYLALYKSSVAGIDKSSLQKALSNHFMSFILNKDNPFLVLEEMLIEHSGSHDFVIENPITSEFILENKESFVQPSLVDDVLSIFENNNSYKIETKARAYYRRENKGVLFPLLVNYFANNGRPAVAVEIIKHQLAKLAVNGFICEISPKNTLYLLKEAFVHNISLNDYSMLNILCRILPVLTELSDEYMNFMLPGIKSLFFTLSSEECNAIEDIFARCYTTDLGKVYVRCMPRHHFFEENMRAFAAKRALYWNKPELEYVTGPELQMLRKEYLDEAAANQKMIQPMD